MIGRERCQCVTSRRLGCANGHGSSLAESPRANGNLANDGAGTTFVCDVENRLVSASGARSAALAYDPLGRLWETSGACVTTRFVYDGDELVAELDASGAVLRRYLHGAGVDDPAVWYEGAGFASPRFLHADNQGSVAAMDGDNTYFANGLLVHNKYFP